MLRVLLAGRSAALGRCGQQLADGVAQPPQPVVARVVVADVLDEAHARIRAGA